MFDSVYFFFMAVVGVFAVGDLISFFTKGKLSGLMMVMLLFLIAFLTGILPADVIDRAGLTEMASVSTGMLLFNMGSTINVRQLIREWRTVALATLCLIGTCISMIVIVGPIVGIETVLTTIPPINGAAVATSIMSDAAAAAGLNTAAALCAVIFATQRFVGAPIASTMGRRYAKVLLEEYRKDPKLHMMNTEAKSDDGKTQKVLFCDKYKSLFSSNVLIGIVAAGAFIARLLGSVTLVDYSIWALLLGLICSSTGIVPQTPLQKGNAFGLIMICVFGSIIPALGGVTADQLGTMAFQLIVLFGTACLGIFIVAWILPCWKLVGNRNLAVGIGAMQFLGFPSNIVVVREVSEVVGETEDEKLWLNSKLSVSYVVGGITVVTILSVVMASIISRYLF